MPTQPRVLIPVAPEYTEFNSSSTAFVGKAALPGTIIHLWRVLLYVNGTDIDVTFQSNSTDKLGPCIFSKSGLLIPMPHGTPGVDYAHPWMSTVAGEALNLTLSSSARLSGRIWYTQQ